MMSMMRHLMHVNALFLTNAAEVMHRVDRIAQQLLVCYPGHPQAVIPGIPMFLMIMANLAAAPI